MSELRGYKCDACGLVIFTGCRITGNKIQKIHGETATYGYRFDLCDKCYDRIKAECSKKEVLDER